MEEKVPPEPPSCLLPTLSPDEVHKNILGCHALRNRVTRKLLEWLHVLIARDYAGALGFPCPAQYVMEVLHYEKSEAYCVVHVAESLPGLPRCAEAFEQGRISWSALKHICRVATGETEESWLSFARTHSAAMLKEEVREAEEAGRDHPRKRRYGLPNTFLRVEFLVSREENEVVQKAMEKKAEEMREERGEEGWRPAEKEVFLAICADSLRSDPAAGGRGRKRPIFDIVFTSCPDCLASHVLTGAGPVEVPREHLARIEGEARKMEIRLEEMVRGEVLAPGEVEGEVPQEMEVKVLASHDHACARCGRRLDLHIHHIVFKSKGGPHEVWNLLPACRRCHANIHEGTLEVHRDPLGALYWMTRARRIGGLLEGELKEMASIPSPVVVIGGKGEAGGTAQAVPQAEGVPGGKGTPALAAEGSKAEGPKADGRREEEWAAAALGKLGYPKSEARRLVWGALEKLGGLGRAPRAEETLNAALGRRAVAWGPFSARAENGSAGP
jgi:hypothetical protein